MTDRRNPLLAVLRNPAFACALSLDDWNVLLQQARRERFLGRVHHLLTATESDCRVPERALEIMQAARTYVDFHQLQIKRELRALNAALEDIDTDLILLKGAAYLEADLPPASGRHMADLDILVPQRQLDTIERRLVAQGWESQKLDRYDQRYYREWMHEIPPLKDPERGIEVDIHHALLPMTARVRPNPELLWQASVALGSPGLRVLAPTDMLLHSAAHLFYDGEIKGGLRDLMDLHQMFGDFGRQPEFWDSLPRRAAVLQLIRPLFYAMRYCRRILGTRIPADAATAIQRRGAPGPSVRAAMDHLVDLVLRPRLPDAQPADGSALLLYMRSHWLRMPPWLLAKHLSRKAIRRGKWQTRKQLQP